MKKVWKIGTLQQEAKEQQDTSQVQIWYLNYISTFYT